LIGARPTATTVSIRPIKAVSDNFLIKKIHDTESTVTQFKNKSGQLDSIVSNLQSDKRRLEAKIALLEYRLTAEKQLERDRYELIVGRHPELRSTKCEADALELDRDQLYKIDNLERQIQMLRPVSIVEPAPQPPVLEITPPVLEITPPVLEITPPVQEIVQKKPSSVYCVNCGLTDGTTEPCGKCYKPVHRYCHEICCQPMMCEADGCNSLFCQDCADKWKDEYCSRDCRAKCR
jgi:hypothetical protein